MKVGNLVVDPVECIKSISILKKGGTACTFQAELYDATFLLELELMKFVVPVTISYGNKNGKSSYTGMITGVASNPVLHQGVELTVSGYLSSKYLNATKAYTYKATEYQGSVLKIARAHLETYGIDLVVDPSISDQFITDSQMRPVDVTSDASENALEFVGKLVRYLGDAEFVMVPASSSKKRSSVVITKKGTEGSVVVVGKGKGKGKEVANSPKRSKLVLEVNHRDNIASDYKLDLKKTKYAQYGTKSKVVSVDNLTNSISTTNITSNTSLIGSSLSNPSDFIGGIEKVVNGGTTSNTKVVEEEEVKDAVSAVYTLSFDLYEGYPSLMPFLSEVKFVAHITAEQCKVKSRKHHSTGTYVVKEITDTITATSIRTSVVSFRTPT
jgi:stage V sporulation protein SpoVS